MEQFKNLFGDMTGVVAMWKLIGVSLDNVTALDFVHCDDDEL